MRQRLAWLVVIGLIVSGCRAQTAAEGGDGNAPAIQTDAPAQTERATPEPTVEPTERPTPRPTPVPTPGTATFAVGDVITITQGGDDWADITVVSAAEKASYPGEYFSDEPQIAGNVFLEVYVRYEAIANGVDYNPFDFQVFVEGRAIDGWTLASNGPQPELSSGVLPAGRVAEGYLLYEVPPTGDVLLSYGGNMFSDQPPVFEVVLRPG